MPQLGFSLQSAMFPIRISAPLRSSAQQPLLFQHTESKYLTENASPIAWDHYSACGSSGTAFCVYNCQQLAGRHQLFGGLVAELHRGCRQYMELPQRVQQRMAPVRPSHDDIVDHLQCPVLVSLLLPAVHAYKRWTLLSNWNLPASCSAVHSRRSLHLHRAAHGLA